MFFVVHFVRPFSDSGLRAVRSRLRLPDSGQCVLGPSSWYQNLQKGCPPGDAHCKDERADQEDNHTRIENSLRNAEGLCCVACGDPGTTRAPQVSFCEGAAPEIILDI